MKAVNHNHVLCHITIQIECNMFRFEIQKPSSGKIKVPRKTRHANYINPMYISVKTAENSTSHFS